jgi:ribonuclease T2
MTDAPSPSSGTCYSTLNPSCFPNYSQQEDVVAFFRQAVNQFKSIDTYSVRLRPSLSPALLLPC